MKSFIDILTSVEHIKEAFGGPSRFDVVFDNFTKKLPKDKVKIIDAIILFSKSKDLDKGDENISFKNEALKFQRDVVAGALGGKEEDQLLLFYALKPKILYMYHHNYKNFTVDKHSDSLVDSWISIALQEFKRTRTFKKNYDVTLQDLLNLDYNLIKEIDITNIDKRRGILERFLLSEVAENQSAFAAFANHFKWDLINVARKSNREDYFNASKVGKDTKGTISGDAMIGSGDDGKADVFSKIADEKSHIPGQELELAPGLIDFMDVMKTASPEQKKAAINVINGSQNPNEIRLAFKGVSSNKVHFIYASMLKNKEEFLDELKESISNIKNYLSRFNEMARTAGQTSTMFKPLDTRLSKEKLTQEEFDDIITYIIGNKSSQLRIDRTVKMSESWNWKNLVQRDLLYLWVYLKTKKDPSLGYPEVPHTTDNAKYDNAQFLQFFFNNRETVEIISKYLVFCGSGYDTAMNYLGQYFAYFRGILRNGFNYKGRIHKLSFDEINTFINSTNADLVLSLLEKSIPNIPYMKDQDIYPLLHQEKAPQTIKRTEQELLDLDL